MKSMSFISAWLLVILLQNSIIAAINSKYSAETAPTPEIISLINDNKDGIINALAICDNMKFDGTPTVTPVAFILRTDDDKTYPGKWVYVKIKVKDSKLTEYTQLRFFKRDAPGEKVKLRLTHIGKGIARKADAAVCIGPMHKCYKNAYTNQCKARK